MDLGTIIGLLSGTAIIIIGILLSGGDLFWFTQFNALIIVLGGTLAATMVNLPIHAVGNLFAILKKVATTTFTFCLLATPSSSYILPITCIAISLNARVGPW